MQPFRAYSWRHRCRHHDKRGAGRRWTLRERLCHFFLLGEGELQSFLLAVNRVKLALWGMWYHRFRIASILKDLSGALIRFFCHIWNSAFCHLYLRFLFWGLGLHGNTPPLLPVDLQPVTCCFWPRYLLLHYFRMLLSAIYTRFFPLVGYERIKELLGPQAMVSRSHFVR